MAAGRVLCYAIRMKTKIIIAIITGVVGFAGGYLVSFWGHMNQMQNQPSEQDNRREELHLRTESYLPDCAELTRKGVPQMVKKGDDYYWVHTTDDYCYVMGLNIEPGQPPITTWWGAGLEYERQRACKKQAGKDG